MKTKQHGHRSQTLITKWMTSKKKETASDSSGQQKLSIPGIPQCWTRDTRISFLLKNPKMGGSSAFERYQKYKYAKTIREALISGAFPGDLANDFGRGFLKRAQEKADPKAFQYVASLGCRCVVAELLRDQGLRRFALPFDWIYSSPEMVAHCLRDNFSKLFDKQLIVKSGKAYGHKLYGPMLKRGIVFPHHNPGGKQNADFQKRIHRFKYFSLDSRKRKLFVLANVIESDVSLVKSRSKLGKLELGTVFQALLKRGISNFAVLVVNLVCGGPSEAKADPITKPLPDQSQKSGQNSLVAFELHCKGACTGLVLKKSEDMEAFGELVLQDRVFDLAPDPLQESAEKASSVLHPKLSVKRDSNGNWRAKHMD